MSFEKLMRELEATGIMSRSMALGEDADENLSIMEGTKIDPKERKVDRICLHCGARSNSPEFIYTHECETPTIIEYKNWPCPSRPKEVKFFEIKYHTKTYKFHNYHSAMRFRQLIWLDNIPLRDAIKDKYLRWY